MRSRSQFMGRFGLLRPRHCTNTIVSSKIGPPRQHHHEVVITEYCHRWNNRWMYLNFLCNSYVAFWKTWNKIEWVRAESTSTFATFETWMIFWSGSVRTRIDQWEFSKFESGLSDPLISLHCILVFIHFLSITHQNWRTAFQNSFNFPLKVKKSETRS